MIYGITFPRIFPVIGALPSELQFLEHMPTFFETRTDLLSGDSSGTWPFLGWRQSLARRKRAMSENLELEFCYLRDKETSVAEAGKGTRRHNRSVADRGGRASQHLQPSPEGDRTPEGGRLSGPRDRAGGAAGTEKVVLSPESRVGCGRPRGGDGVLQSWGSAPPPSGTSCLAGLSLLSADGATPSGPQVCSEGQGSRTP